MTNEPVFSAEEALAHLREVDPVLARVIDQAGPYAAPRRADPYAALVRTILFQQLAGAAASAIQRRLFARFGAEDQVPTPEQLLSLDEDEFRSVGVSRQKAGYMH